MLLMFSELPLFINAPSSTMAEYIDSGRLLGETSLAKPLRLLRCNLKQARRCVSRFIAGRRVDHHVYRVPGSAFDDPQYVQDIRRVAAGCIPCLRTFIGGTGSFNLRRPFGCHEYKTIRIRDDSDLFSPGNYGSCPGRASGGY